MRKINVIDLFAGCGGFSEGFMQTNKFEFLAHIEWEKPMIDTLRLNLVEKWGYKKEEALEKVIRFDIQKLDELFNGKIQGELLDKYSDNSIKFLEKGLDEIIHGNEVDLIIGGPPCQAYSIAGRAQDKYSMKFDYRNYLFESFVEIVNRYKPKFFVFENVPGILSAKPGDVLVVERIYAAFEKIGYIIRDSKDLKNTVYSSLNYDVPQDRKRVIIFGVKKGLENCIETFYSTLNEKKENKIKTVRDAIGDLPRFFPLENSYKVGNRNYSHKKFDISKITLHEARYHNQRDIKIFEKWIRNNMNNATVEEKIKFYEENTGKTTKHNKYRNLEWDKPSPTIVSHLQKDGLMFIHPDIEQLRSITVREAAILQSFPIDYKFVGSMSFCYKMIGNAVPVNMSKKIAESVFKTFNDIKTSKKLNILVACEESQRVCSEFRKLGHNAFSCDLLECSGGHPEWHFKQDVFNIIEKKGGILQNGEEVYIDGNWDLMIAHPPCTYLAVSGAKWYYHPDDSHLPVNQRRPHPKFPNRAKDREEAIDFFIKLMNVDIEHIALENPIGIMSSIYRKPDQIVHPYHFGDSASKATCLWLKNLTPLKHTNIVEKGDYITFKSGKKIPKWYSDAFTKAKTAEERRNLRSKTFPGFAKAIATQWSKELEK